MQNEEHLFVTCNGSGEVRVIDLATDEVIRVIPILGKPWLLDMTDDGEKIYVGNWGKDGVDVIDTGDLSFHAPDQHRGRAQLRPPARGGDHAIAMPSCRTRTRTAPFHSTIRPRAAGTMAR